MRIITKDNIKTLFEIASEVAQKHENTQGDFIIKKSSTKIEFILCDSLTKRVECFSVDYNNAATYYSNEITQQSLDAFERFFGKGELEKFVFSIVQAKLNNF